MASSPSFAATPRVGAAAVSTANTNRDGSGTIVTVLSAGSNGTKIEEVVLKATADPADSTVVLYLHDGSSAWAYDEIDLDDPATGSATVASYRHVRRYENLILPNGWSLRASITAAPTSGSVNVIATGADF